MKPKLQTGNLLNYTLLLFFLPNSKNFDQLSLCIFLLFYVNDSLYLENRQFETNIEKKEFVELIDWEFWFPVKKL